MALLGEIGVHLGRLPGDIAIEKDGYRFYFPWFTCLVVSLFFSLGMRLWKGFFRNEH